MKDDLENLSQRDMWAKSALIHKFEILKSGEVSNIMGRLHVSLRNKKSINSTLAL